MSMRIPGGALEARNGFDQQLRFGPGNQDIARNRELAAIKFLMLRDVLGRFAFEALVEIASVVDPLDFAKFLFRVRVEVHPLAVHRMAHLCAVVARGSILLECRANGHCDQ